MLTVFDLTFNFCPILYSDSCLKVVQMYRNLIAIIAYYLETFLHLRVIIWVTYWDINNGVNFKRRNILHNHVLVHSGLTELSNFVNSIGQCILVFIFSSVYSNIEY